jgi:hypothetical protein
MHHLFLQEASTVDTAAMLALLLPVFIFWGIVVVVCIIAQWVVFTKAGRGGWEVLIPFYGTIVLLQIVGKPWWWLLLMIFLPGINLIWFIWMTNMLSKSFGKDEGFTVGLLLLSFVFYPILAFGKAEYQGPYGDKAAYDAYRASKHPFEFEQKTA